jgi:hypothetical protein
VAHPKGKDGLAPPGLLALDRAILCQAPLPKSQGAVKHGIAIFAVRSFDEKIDNPQRHQESLRFSQCVIVHVLRFSQCTILQIDEIAISGDNGHRRLES